MGWKVAFEAPRHATGYRSTPPLRDDSSSAHTCLPAGHHHRSRAGDDAEDLVAAGDDNHSFLAILVLTDDSIGALQDGRRNCHTEITSDLEVDYELALGNDLERSNRWIRSFENFVDDDRHAWIAIREGCAEGHHSTRGRGTAPKHRRDRRAAAIAAIRIRLPNGTGTSRTTSAWALCAAMALNASSKSGSGLAASTPEA